MKELTRRQAQILEYIKIFYRKNGLPPTVREIGDKFGMASSSMFDHLIALQRKGYIQRRSNKSRSLELTEFLGNKWNMPSTIEIPLLGRVAAGKPILAVENIDETIAIDRNWISTEDVFALKIKGDSMIDAHILEGDLVIVKKQNHANNNEMIVAILNDEATVKTYYKEKDKIRLQPENRNMTPIYIESSSPDLKIIGKVIGILRKYS